ncbi:MAG: phage holin family protein [Acidimicrobiia bacterium]|nr:phage holin family protein [Acidimicrobiia bacterium]
MRLLIRTGLMVLAVWAVFVFVPGLDWNDEWLTLLVVAVLIGLANAVVRPVLKALTLPIRMMTLGLFTLVLNIALMAGVLWLAETLELGVSSEGWGWTALGGLLLAVASSVISMVGD